MIASLRWCSAHALIWGAAALLAVLSGSGPAWGAEPAAPRARSSCVDCHSNPRFMVQNKKLYDYYQGWRLSIHEQEKVTCVDCHGGNPRAADKPTAHGDQGMSASVATSPIAYQIAALARPIALMPESSDHIEHQGKHGAEQNRGCEWEIEGRVFSAVENIPREATYRKTGASKEQE